MVSTTVSYAHLFERYFEFEGRRVDKLNQVLQHGILSPREAEKRGLPFKRNIRIKMEGVENYDDVIFLFPIKTPNYRPLWSNAVSVLIAPSLSVLTVEDMEIRYSGKWLQMSWVHGGEVYTFSRVDPQYFTEVVFPTESPKELEEVRKLAQRYIPEMTNIRIRGPYVS